jgi:hypothetical protein
MLQQHINTYNNYLKSNNFQVENLHEFESIKTQILNIVNSKLTSESEIIEITKFTKKEIELLLKYNDKIDGQNNNRNKNIK